MGNHAWKAYLGVGVVATAILLTRPDRATVEALWMVLSGATAVAVLVGVWVHRPPRRLPFYLLMAALVLVMARLLLASNVDVTGSGFRAMLVGTTDLTAHLLIGAVVVLLVRYQTPGRDREAVLDAAIVMMAVATMSWTLTLGPSGLGAETAPAARGFIGAVLLVAAGVTAVCTRLLFVSGRRVPAAAMIGVAGLLLLPATVGWIAALTTQVSWAQPLADHLWAALLTSTGAGVIHPSMSALTRPTVPRLGGVTRGRLIVLGTAVVATPAALIPATAPLRAGLTLPVVGVTVLALIVLIRLSRLVTDRERARYEATTRAAHEAAISRLAAGALEQVPLAELLAQAEATIATHVSDTAVTIVNAADRTGPAMAAPRRPVPILGLDGPIAWIHAEPRSNGALGADAREFIGAVANVLAAAAQRRQAEDELRHLASHDPLTGLPNRIRLFDRIKQALLRRGEPRLGVLFLDLDGFKAVNDTYGHEAGDHLLLVVADRLAATVRAGDTVARLAGDEFVVLLDPCDEPELLRVAGRLVDAVAAPIDLARGVVEISTSVGAILSQPGDQDPEALLRRADEAMYAAKQRDGQAVVVAEPTG